MPFCAYCGKPVKPKDKFCGVCGQLISTPQMPATPVIGREKVPEVKTPDTAADRIFNDSTVTAVESTSKTLPSVETVKMIVPVLLLIYGFGKSDTFNLVITTHRSIFAKLTRSIKEQSQKKMNEKVGNMKINPLLKLVAKRIDYNAYLEWYADKTPHEILSETPGNYAIINTDILDVLIKDESWTTEDGSSVPGYELVLTTREKVLKFKTNVNPENIRGKNIFDAYKK